MAYVIFILVCLAIGFLTIKYFRILAGLAMLLVAAFILGFLIMPFDLDLGGKVVGYSAGFFICGYVIHIFSLMMSAIFAAPFALIWLAIKALFSK